MFFLLCRDNASSIVLCRCVDTTPHPLCFCCVVITPHPLCVCCCGEITPSSIVFFVVFDVTPHPLCSCVQLAVDDGHVDQPPPEGGVPGPGKGPEHGHPHGPVLAPRRSAQGDFHNSTAINNSVTHSSPPCTAVCVFLLVAGGHSKWDLRYTKTYTGIFTYFLLTSILVLFGIGHP